MIKSSVYLPEELEAEARASGESKAELIRRGVRELLERQPQRELPPWPTFNSGRSLTPEQTDEIIRKSIAERAARR